MKVVSYNVNGIRAAIKKGFVDWLREGDYDIVCIQETKSQPEQVDMSEIEALGYHHHWHSAVKKGYSGVLTLSKEEPKSVEAGIGIEKYDIEGRVIRTDFEAFSLYNCYFPSGSSGEERHAFKMDFLSDMRTFASAKLEENSNTIILGDYNIVHTEQDIHNPKRKDKPSGYRPEERAWLDQWFGSDFKDGFRKIHPDTTEDFSWWSYRGGSRQRNKGWRIDYVAVTNELAEKIVDAGHMPDAKHSDHCATWIELAL